MKMDEAPIMAQFEQEVDAALDKYRGQGMTYGEAIGALENVKLCLFLEQQTDMIRQIATEP